MTALAAIHVAKRDLGLDDDTYRDLLERETGKRSAKDMSAAELDRVLAVLRRSGFKGASKRPGSRRKLSGPYARKAQALWIALWNLGAVRNRDDRALLDFARSQTGIERLEWVLSAEDGAAVIEALKAWCGREGVDWTPRKAAWADRHGYRIAAAQWDRLKATDNSVLDFWTEVAMLLPDGAILGDRPSDDQWIAVMNRFGQRLRALPSRKA